MNSPEAAAPPPQDLAPRPLSPTDIDRLRQRPLVLFFDVDGTLAPIASRPDQVVVPPRTLHALSAFAARPRTHVIIVTGRAAADAARIAGVPGAWIVGNHGSEIVDPSGAIVIDADVAAREPHVAAALAALERDLSGVPGIVIENKRWSLSVHYRLADPAIEPILREVVDRIAAANNLRVTTGKLVFELRAPVDINKGTAVVSLANRLGALNAEASVFFAGDDRTDEDAFVALRTACPTALTVRVLDAAHRDFDTRAECTVKDTAELATFLQSLIDELITGTG